MYKSPFSVAWRKPIKLDVNDPRAKSSMDFEKYRARVGSEVSQVGEERDLYADPGYDVEIGDYLAGREYVTANFYVAITLTLSEIGREYTTVNVV